jgi:multidrug transporter EmrE-like cation transporter
MNTFLIFLAAAAFALGGIAMKYAEGLSKLLPSLAAMLLFVLGAGIQTIAMKQQQMSVTYIAVLGLEALLAFGFGVVFFKEGYALSKLAGAALVVLGVAFLRS